MTFSNEPGEDGGPSRPCRKENETPPPISVTFSHRSTGLCPKPLRNPCARAGGRSLKSNPSQRPSPSIRRVRKTGCGAFWEISRCTGRQALAVSSAALGRAPQYPYAEEAAEAPIATPVEPPVREPAEAANPEPVRAEPAKTEDQLIGAELGLSPDLATVDLQRIRRDFAKKNHPDRFEPARRTNAARRMSIANMLIDEQMRQNRLPH